MQMYCAAVYDIGSEWRRLTTMLSDFNSNVPFPPRVRVIIAHLKMGRRGSRRLRSEKRLKASKLAQQRSNALCPPRLKFSLLLFVPKRQLGKNPR